MNPFGSTSLFGQPLSVLHFFFIAIHVFAALFALVIAPLVMVVQKGGKQHRRWGKFYFWAMFVTNAVALLLLIWRFNLFLFGVTILSFYSALSGYRVLYRKRPLQGSGPTWFDWGVAILALATGVLLLAWGVLTAFGLTWLRIPDDGGLFIVYIILPIIFGLSISKDALTDLRMFRQPSPDPNWWWYYHMERMLGSYTALVTALLVQRVGPYLPFSIAWIVWVTPATIGSIAIIAWTKAYQAKFAQRHTSARPPLQPVNL